ncbi:MAG: alpha/beta fold hydrolase [Vicinamibacterales bacterium]
MDAPAIGDHFDEACAAGAANVEDLVLRAFRHHLSMETLGPDENFFERGGDSAQAMQIVHAISRGVGAQVPTDLLFRYPTPRQLAAFLQPGHAEIRPDPRATVVTFSRQREGDAVFLVPPLYPSPWVFVPLAESMNLARPLYGLRSPELDWRTDVLSLPELVAHYVTEIRRLQPRGPYTLVGYSFGGLVAFEAAARLAMDEAVRHLILLDTAGPLTRMHRLRKRLRPGWLLHDVLAALSRRAIIGAGTLERLGITSPVYRATLPFTNGPLAAEELRTALRLLAPGMTWIDSMSLDELCATLVATVKALAPEAEWAMAQKHLPLHGDDPVSAVKAYKVLSKNRSIARHHKVRTVFRGAITIFASTGNRDVLRWQPHSSHPLDVKWVPAASYSGVRTHMSFLDGRNVRLYARELKQILEDAA